MKNLRYPLIIASVLVLGTVSYFASTIGPVYQDLLILRKGYSVFNYDETSKTVSYKITSKRPDYWISLREISNEAIFSIVISEDWAFYSHEGIDYNQLSIVLKEGFETGKITRGASTISQQLVKNLFLTKRKTISRKLLEAVLTMKLESTVEKNKILELYLNSVEFGEGLYGIGHASDLYFGKTPEQLTAKEGAFLAMLLPSPKRYSQSYRDGEVTEFAATTMNEILDKMKRAKILTEEQWQRARRERLPFEGPVLDDPLFYEEQTFDLQALIESDAE